MGSRDDLAKSLRNFGRKIRAPLDKRSALIELERFHSKPRSLDETIDAAMSSDLTATLHKQAAYQAMCYLSNDIKEGIDSVRNKRTPHFSDEY